MNYDIAIIGAGPSGLSFAISLRNSGLKIVVIEKLSARQLADPAVDGRDIALTHLSRRLMQQQCSWQRVDPEQISPIETAEVIDGNSPYALHFETPNDDSDALGFLISNHLIRKAIYEEFTALENVTLLDQCEVYQVRSDEDKATIILTNDEVIHAELVVAADTRFSSSRQQMGISADYHEFGRTAIVCEAEHELSHNHTAFECFHYGRTLAILPMPGNTSSVVITVPTTLAQGIMDMSEDEFNRDVEQQLNHKLGRMKLIGQRYMYPLVGVHANRFYTRRFALIGDAAVGMHPVTAHGFNLGLSGQDLLANEILQALDKGKPYWSADTLKRYQQQHMLTTRPLYHGTNTVVSLFTNDTFPATLLRKAALRISNNLPPIKWAIQQKLMAKKQIKELLPRF